MRARMCWVRVAPGDCYPRRSHPGSGLQGIFALGRCGRIRADAGQAARTAACTYRAREHSSAAGIDTQSTRPPHGGDSGFDAGKKIEGRKRNLVVDTMALLTAVTVTAPSVQDKDDAAVVAQASAKSPWPEKLYTDSGNGMKCARFKERS